MVTLGTGIGIAVFNDGILVPNAEYRHLLLDGVEAEELAFGRARRGVGSTWEQWTHHVESFLRELERLIWPDPLVIGGGISEESRFCAELDTRASVIVAALRNDAGIVGAALAGEGLMTEELDGLGSSR